MICVWKKNYSVNFEELIINTNERLFVNDETKHAFLVYLIFSHFSCRACMMEGRGGEETSSALPYKVGVPPKQKFWTEFSTTLKETFFSDDPLHSFKDQSRSRKLVLGLEAVFPILEWGKKYSLDKFKGDLIAGLTIASLCIPQVCYSYKPETLLLNGESFVLEVV